MINGVDSVFNVMIVLPPFYDVIDCCKMIGQKMKCADCKYFKKIDGIDREDAGLCRQSPPVLADARDSYGSWPWVVQDSWCGKFEVKDTAD